jgi:hypothetical protein
VTAAKCSKLQTTSLAPAQMWEEEKVQQWQGTNLQALTNIQSVQCIEV